MSKITILLVSLRYVHHNWTSVTSSFCYMRRLWKYFANSKNSKCMCKLGKKTIFHRQKKIQLHTSCGAALYVKSSDDCFFGKPVVLHDGNVAEEFLDLLMAVADEITHFLRKKIPMKTTYSAATAWIWECNEVSNMQQNISATG